VRTALVSYATRASVPICGYLDELLWSCAGDTTRGEGVISFMYGLLYCEGFFVAVLKSTCSPLTKLEFLGLLLDLKERRLWVPPAKRQSVLGLLAHILVGRDCGVMELKRLVGKASFLSFVIPGGRWFLRYQYWAVAEADATGDKLIPLTDELREELIHWRTLLDFWQGAPFPDARQVAVALYTDASSGFWAGKVWAAADQALLRLPAFGGPIPGHLLQEHIQVKEAYALVRAIELLGREVQKVWVDVGIDNTAVLFGARLMRCHSRPMFAILREIAELQRRFNLRISYHYVPTKLDLAD
jgi:hypothetical protein